MRAVRIRKNVSGTHYAVHWLTDDGTVCGRALETFTVDALLDLDELPSVEGCRGCLRVTAFETRPDYGRSRRVTDSVDAHRLDVPTNQIASGRVTRLGPLRHGSRLY